MSGNFSPIFFHVYPTVTFPENNIILIDFIKRSSYTYRKRSISNRGNREARMFASN